MFERALNMPMHIVSLAILEIKLAKQVTKKLKRMSIDMFSWSQEKLFEKCCKFPKHPHGSVLLKLNRKIQLLNLIFK